MQSGGNHAERRGKAQRAEFRVGAPVGRDGQKVLCLERQAACGPRPASGQLIGERHVFQADIGSVADGRVAGHVPREGQARGAVGAGGEHLVGAAAVLGRPVPAHICRLVDHRARAAEHGNGVVVFLLYELEEEVQLEAAVADLVQYAPVELRIQVFHRLAVVWSRKHPVPVGIFKGVCPGLRIDAGVLEYLDDVERLPDHKGIGIGRAFQPRKGNQPVFGGGKVDIGGPAECIGLDIGRAQGQFHAFIFDHRVQVGLQRGKARGCWKRDADQLAGGAVAVPGPAAKDAVLQEARFHGDLQLPVFFPTEVGVVEARGLQAGNPHVVRTCRGIGIQELVVADLVAAAGAVAGAELAEAEQAVGLHPAFLGKYPGGACGPEIGELPPGTEAARAVPPSSQVEQEPAVPVQVGAPEGRLVLVYGLVVGRYFGIGSRGQVVDQAVGRKPAAELRQQSCALPLEGRAGQEFQPGLSQFLFPVQLGLGDPGRSGRAGNVDRGEIGTESEGGAVGGRRGGVALLVVQARIAQACLGLEAPGQPVGEREARDQVARSGQRFSIERGKGIGERPVFPVQFSRFGVERRGVRGRGPCRGAQVPGGLVVVLQGIARRKAEGELLVGGMVVQAGAQVALAVGKVARKYGGFPVEATADPELGLFAPAGKRGADSGDVCLAAQQFFLPVGVAAGIPGAVDVVGRGGVGGDAVVGERLRAHGQVLPGVHELQEAGDLAAAPREAGGEGRLALLSLFGSNKHDPIGPSGPVDRRGIGILEDFEAFDVGRVQAVQRAGNRGVDGIARAHPDRIGGIGHPVDDVQGRVGVGPKAVGPADLDVEAPARGAGSLGDIDPGHSSLHGGKRIADGLGGDVFGADGGDASGTLLVLYGVVAGIDGDFLQVFAVCLEYGV